MYGLLVKKYRGSWAYLVVLEKQPADIGRCEIHKGKGDPGHSTKFVTARLISNAPH